MSQELHYTSVPRGLKSGSRGFCTVGLTPHMPGPLIDRLEALSGYQPVFAPHDPSAPLNPIVLSHLRLMIGGKAVSVLSRIGPAGLDYSGRPNKYAHHVVLEGNERPEAGPAWLLSQPGFMQAAWQGEPREIPAGRTPPQGDRAPGMAREWHALTGDGGWAGVLAESFLADPRRTVFLVFRPGMDLLPLFLESLALLPASRRWDVDFSTYFNPLPQGVGCAWRGVLEGSDDAKNARRLPNALVVDLCNALDRVEGGALVHFARTGERIAQEPDTATAPTGSARHIPRMPQRAGEPALDAAAPTAVRLLRSAGGSYELVPELARLVASKGAPFGASGGKRRFRGGPWVLVSALVAVGLVALALAGLFLRAESLMKLLGSNPEVAAEHLRVKDEKKRADAKAAESRPQPEILRPKPEENERVRMESAARKEQKPPVPTEHPRNAASVPIVGKPPDAKRIDEEPAILFFALPLIPGSAIGTTPVKPQSIPLRDHNDTIDLKTYYIDDFEVRFVNGNNRVVFSRKSSSSFGGFRVASLERDNGRLHFEWDPEATRNRNQAERLRDGILTINEKSGRRYYVLLRDLRIAETRLSLSPTHGSKIKFVKDDLEPRKKELKWIEGDSLMGTTWPLGIRKWRISSSLPNEPSPKVIASGDEPTLPAEVKAAIIPKEAWVRLEIDTKNKEPHLIKVFLSFERERVIRRWADSKRLKQLVIQTQKTKSEHDELVMLQNRLGTPEQINRIEDIERHLSPPSYAELSVIIGLRIDDSTILEIAKFGDFASTSH